MCHYQEKCDNCGRFLSVGAPGVSWSQSWGYDWGGRPDQRDYPELPEPNYFDYLDEDL